MNPAVLRRGLVLTLSGAACCFAPSTATAAKPPNPCLVKATAAQLRCPDLTMRRPFGFRVDPFTRPGHVLLRAGNSVDSRGAGPAELFGVRDGARTMRARQRIYRRKGGRIGLATGARLIFKSVPTRGGNFWKFFHAASFELYRLDAKGKRTKLVRRGPKVAYCLRDLDHTTPGLARSPRHRVYPKCNQSPRTRKVRLGTSVGWSDVYPPTYPEQWIDVTGLRGCFSYDETADPRNGIYESNERNNTSRVIVRLPFKPGAQGCAGAAKSNPAKNPEEDEGY